MGKQLSYSAKLFFCLVVCVNNFRSCLSASLFWTLSRSARPTFKFVRVKTNCILDLHFGLDLGLGHKGGLVSKSVDHEETLWLSCELSHVLPSSYSFGINKFNLDTEVQIVIICHQKLGIIRMAL